MGQGVHPHPRLVNHSAGDADHRAVRGHIAQQHRAGADAGVRPHGDRPQHLGAGPHHHVLAQGGVALTDGFARAAQGHPLVKQAVVADHAGFADHHAHAVVDEYPLADAGAWVDFNAGEKAPQLADQAGHQGQAQAPELVTEAVQGESMQPRVAEQDFEGAAGGRVPFLNDRQVGPKRLEHHAADCNPISLRSRSIVAAPR